MKARSLVALCLVLTAGVASVGCGGDDSPNTPEPICTYTITPTTTSFPPDGGSNSVTVTAPASCAWTAIASAPWTTITAGSGGTGPGSVAYSVASNPSTESRTATVTIGGQTHTVVQQAKVETACSYALSPGSADVGAEESRGSFTVTAPRECPWTATSNAAWLVVTAGAAGTGDGPVSFTAARNTEATGRSATIAVADKTFAVRQGGDIGVCQYSVAPVAFDPCMPASSVTAVVSAPAGCSWTAAPSVPWLTIPNGSSGSGTGAITIAFPENYDAPRDGIVMVRWPTPTAGQNIRIAQAGCLYAVSRDSFTIAAAGGPGAFDVLQQSLPNTCGGATQDRCIWSAVSDVPWITVTGGMPRSGDNPVAFTVSANATGAARVGRITVRDKVVVVTQPAQ